MDSCHWPECMWQIYTSSTQQFFFSLNTSITSQCRKDTEEKNHITQSSGGGDHESRNELEKCRKKLWAKEERIRSEREWEKLLDEFFLLHRTCSLLRRRTADCKLADEDAQFATKLHKLYLISEFHRMSSGASHKGFYISRRRGVKIKIARCFPLRSRDCSDGISLPISPP